jgi:hypothetical protein
VQLRSPVLQHVGEIFAGMLSSGEVQRDLPARTGRDDPAVKHAGAIVGRLAGQPQHPHAGVVIVDHLGLRRLPNQLVARRLEQLRGFFGNLPLRRCRKRNP